jgi:hypothetical protein
MVVHICNPSYVGGVLYCSPRQKETLYLKKKSPKAKRAEGEAQVEDYLLSKHKSPKFKSHTAKENT